MQTKVGWVFSEPVQGASALNSTQVNFTNTHALRVDTHDQSMDESSENWALERKLAELWDLEAIGISREETSVNERFNEDITFKDGQYGVKLPWKERHATLPDNYTLCQRRLKSLTRRLQSEEITSMILSFKITLTSKSFRRWKTAKYLTLGQEKRIISHITP